jgi:hypothetical protein
LAFFRVGRPPALGDTRVVVASCVPANLRAAGRAEGKHDNGLERRGALRLGRLVYYLRLARPSMLSEKSGGAPSKPATSDDVILEEDEDDPHNLAPPHRSAGVAACGQHGIV